MQVETSAISLKPVLKSSVNGTRNFVFFAQQLDNFVSREGLAFFSEQMIQSEISLAVDPLT